jgi:hypothetical protein
MVKEEKKKNNDEFRGVLGGWKRSWEIQQLDLSLAALQLST